MSLPILEYRDRIIGALENGNRLIIKAPTGSGKSTQVPQILLDSGNVDGTILVLQPRRLAARMLATRVAFERGSEPGQEIGFQTRFETVTSESTRVRFITEGILPRMLLSDRNLSGVSVVIFDEFHERSLTVDLGLALIRNLQESSRPDLKLVVMSATLETGPIVEYLPGASVINSEGWTFPVSIQYFPGEQGKPWELAAGAAFQLVKSGAEGDILVFMPGVYEIRKTVSSLQEVRFGEPVDISMLYGDLPSDRQRQVMEQRTRRKIIVATNIAETSLTIPGVRHVIDSGLARINRYDPVRGFNTLYVEKIALDSAAQRSGRAGREAPGICIRLWSQTDQRSRSRRTQPEIFRVDLAETVLQLKMLGFADPVSFPWIESPEDQSIKAATEFLKQIDAIDKEGKITEKGKRLGEFPMHPRLAALLLESYNRGVVRKGALACAILSERPAFSGIPDVPDEILKQCEGSDFALMEYVINRVAESGFDPGLCRKWNVNISSVQQILRTEAYFLQICRKKGMHTRNMVSGSQPLSVAILAAYSDRLARRRDQGTLLCELSNNRRGELSKESLARGSRLLVAASINELKSKSQSTPRTVLTLACGVREEWLEELFPDDIVIKTELVWNSINQAVESRTRTVCLGVTIDEKVDQNADPEKAGEVLAENIIKRKLPLAGWDNEVQDYIMRCRWLGEIFPEMGFPGFGDEDYGLIVHELCKDESRYSKVKDKPVLHIVKSLLSHEQQRIIETAAPQFVLNKAGRKLRITYKAGSAPVIRARIQELFDMNSSPRVANGRVAVKVEILAPNMRPVQVTEDLENFWKVHYPELKKSLSRRYPKHQWR
jgi:ATP-dependent helicase HrpB